MLGFGEDAAVPFDSLCIPLDECLVVPPGPVKESILLELERSRFDQAPVYSPDTRVLWGLADTEHLRGLFNSSLPVREDDPHIRQHGRFLRIGGSCSIKELLDRLRKQRALIVIRESDATEYGHVEWVLGLFTQSDLNRHEIRAILYKILSDVEVGLASLLEEEMADPWDWLPLLGEESQVRVLGYWELSKRRNQDIGAVAALTISELLNVVAKLDTLRGKLGFRSRKEMDGECGRVRDFRNRIMHPIRPLVLGSEDIERAYETVELLERVRGALPKKKPRRWLKRLA